MKNIYNEATKLSLPVSTALVIFSLILAIHPVSAQSAGTSEKAPTSSKMAAITTRDNNTHFNINTRQLIHYVIDKFGGCPSEIAIYSWFR